MPVFKEIPLRLITPAWDSDLATTIVELEKLRVKRLSGSVPPHVFFQLKKIFQQLESLGSARIEGNRTTLAEFIEKIIERKHKPDENTKEITNLDKAIDFIEANVSLGTEITHALIREIHKIAVEGLTPPPDGEGSLSPGAYRKISVLISKSNHKPPENEHQILSYMDELLEFVNADIEPKNDLLMIALAHHRMTWIHPFDNGNGRVVRLFTYMLLLKKGFKVKVGRILNPTAIFCMDREKYNSLLGAADSGDDKDLVGWCTYVLVGLKNEIEKIDHLLDRDYLIEKILSPSLLFALDRKQITPDEFKILVKTVGSPGMDFRSSDINIALSKTLSSLARTRIINFLRAKEMLMPIKPDGRIYTIGFSCSYLLRGIIKSLEENGFVPASLNNNN